MWKFQSFWNLVPGDKKKIQAGIIILINTVIKYPPDTILSVISRHVFLLHYEYIERTEYFIKEICQMNEKIGPYIFARNWVVLSLRVCVYLLLYIPISLRLCPNAKLYEIIRPNGKTFGKKFWYFSFDSVQTKLFDEKLVQANYRQYSLHAQICARLSGV